MRHEGKYTDIGGCQSEFRFTAVEGQAIVTKPAVQSRQAVTVVTVKIIYSVFRCHVTENDNCNYLRWNI